MPDNTPKDAMQQKIMYSALGPAKAAQYVLRKQGSYVHVKMYYLQLLLNCKHSQTLAQADMHIVFLFWLTFPI